MAMNDWWLRLPPITQDSTITSSEIGDDAITVDHVGSNLWAFIPGEATVVQSTKSSNNEWFLNIQLRDAAGEAFQHAMPVRVWIGSTALAGQTAPSSTSFSYFGVAASATSSGGGPSYDLGGIAAATHTALLDLSFVTDSSGMLTLACVLATDNATTDAMHVIWTGGAYRSSDTIGSTTVAT